MLRRVNWKLVFKCFAWLISLGGIITLMSFVSVKKNTITCTNIKILIPGADNFIEREEIDAILKQSQGTLIGRKLESINLHAIERKIQSNPYIAQSTVYADMDGVIHIEISQRQPLLRVINAGGQDYYIDRDGLKMPISPNFTADVLVANGHILEHFGGRVDTLITKMAADLYRTALYLKKDTLWDAQIEQIFVNDKDDIELVPRVGDQRIILGSADSLEIKMANLLIFYKKAMPQVGWDTYKTINIKYTNQIVCEKNKVDSLNGFAVRAVSVKHTQAQAKKVIDSLVNAQIAAELSNNPEADVAGDEVIAVKRREPEKKKEAVKKPVVTKQPEKKKEPEKKAVKKTVVTIQPEKKKDPVIKAAAVKQPEKKEPVKAPTVTVKKKEPVKTITVKKVEPVKSAEPVKTNVTARKSWPPHANEKKDTKKNK
ncbi:cell division protein FtsQ/DivIB [Pedobacter sp. MR2016-24]|uniref:cell division protein FtsQ/DivIB n=1 Tax=Pedobacter sp. MR2016-24 TaxID=2994466 RepID=UPI002246CD83|nr:cell division protein FtsQ [Pedobacter sp. MR2016-24]MCX2484075.1 cell division protein FtsQ [Pedobacter sp. MR2016-24]